MRAALFATIFFGLISNSVAFGQEWIQEYETSYNTGDSLKAQKKYDEAISYFQLAYQLAAKHRDSTRAADAGLEAGYCQVLNGLISAGVKTLKEVDSLYYEAYPPERKAFFKNRIGLGYGYLGNSEQAVEEYRIALQFALQFDDTTDIISIANNLANRVNRFGDYDGSIEYANLVLKYTPKTDLYRLANIGYSFYIAYLYKGMYDTAAPYLFKSCELGESIKNDAVLSLCYYYLSDYYKNRNDYSKAITSSEKGLALANKINDKEDVARYYYLLGDLYLSIEEVDRALSYLNRVVDYYEIAGNKTLLAEALVKIAECFRIKKNYGEAERLLLLALEYYEPYDVPYLKGRALIFLADIKIQEKKDAEAMPYLEASNDIGIERDNFWLRQDSQSRLIKIDNSILSPEEKLRLSKKVNQAAQRLSLNALLWSERNLAKSYSAVDSDSAFFWAESSFDLIEKGRRSFKGGTLKAGLFADHANYYNEVGSWYANKKGDISKAFELVEASKARALLDELAEANQYEELKLDEASQMQLLELQKTTDQLYRAREAAPDEAEFQRLTNEIGDAELRYDSALERIAASNPAWSQFLYPETLSLKEVQKLTDSETAIIEYAFTDEKLLIFFISENDAFYYESDPIPFLADSLASSINDFRDAIVEQADESILASKSEGLFAMLLEPVADKISGFSNLVIVPDGPISFLPFDALQHNGRYLVSDFTINHLPSVSVYNHIQSPRRKTSKSLLAVASSGFTTNSDNNLGTQNAFAALPFTLIEVDSIATNFEAESKTILKNDAVTEASIKNISLDQYKYIHFATHGDINEVTPSQSGLILSKKQETEILFGEDGLLNAKEIASLNLNADLVVLSACNTGMGRVITGEGLLGLQRSFLAAGASSVVSSLWSIYDRSTPLFMQTFYSKLSDYEENDSGFINRFLRWSNLSNPKLVNNNALALRDAKLEMIEHPYYSHPVHWASFVITGK